MYHIAAAVEAFGPWSIFKSTNVDGEHSVLWLAAEQRWQRGSHV